MESQQVGGRKTRQRDLGEMNLVRMYAHMWYLYLVLHCNHKSIRYAAASIYRHISLHMTYTCLCRSMVYDLFSSEMIFGKIEDLPFNFLQCGMMKLKLMMRIIMPVPVGQRYFPIDTKAAKWTQDPKRNTFEEFQPEKSRHPKASMCFKHQLRSAN